MILSSVKQSPKSISSYTHLVADLDKTLVDGRIAEGMGVYFLKDEAKRLHLPHVILGIKNYGRVKEMAEKGEAEGLKCFFDIVGRTGCANFREFHAYAERYLKRHSLPGADAFMMYFSRIMPTFIATLGSNIAASEAASHYNCTADNTMSNPVTWGYCRSCAGSIRGIDIKIRDGKDKLEVVKSSLMTHGLDVSKGIAIGNDRYDHETLKASALALSSPLADKDTIELVRGLNGVVIADFNSYLKELESA